VPEVICRIDIQTGEGFCRLEELWERERSSVVLVADGREAAGPAPAAPGSAKKAPAGATPAGYSEAELAAILDLTADGLSIRERLAAREMLEAGMNYREIARRLRKEYWAVAGLRWKLSVLDQHIRVLVLAEKGLGDDEIARAAGLSRARVREIRRGYRRTMQAAAGE